MLRRDVWLFVIASGCGRIDFDLQAPATTHLVIEDVPGGRGVPLADVSVRIGQTVAAFAVARAPDGSFLADRVVTWSTSGGDIATIESGPSNGTHLTFTMAGNTRTTAADPELGTAISGTLAAVPCAAAGDCSDACHVAGTCTEGACIYGPATKDSDGDGAVDLACVGGTDCDDDPQACGSQCRPGGSDVCDGNDNDCNLATADGSTDPLVGVACDGNDADTCVDDRTVCTAGVTSCSSGLDTCNGAPIGPVADTFTAGPGTANGSGTNMFVGHTAAGSNATTFIQFDLSAYPANTQITSAILRLHEVTSSGTTPIDVVVQRVLASWTEGTLTTANMPTFDANVWATTTVTLQTQIAFTWDVTALVQGWIDGTYPNDGMVLQAPSSANGDIAQFGSKENTTAAVRPELIVTTP